MNTTVTLLAMLIFAGAFAQADNPASRDLDDKWERAIAQEIEVGSVVQLSNNTAPPIFSNSSSKIAYASTVETYETEFGVVKIVQNTKLIVVSVSDLKQTAAVDLPFQIASIAFSPDDNKILCLVSDVQSEYEYLLVDLKSLAIVKVKRLHGFINPPPRLTWTDSNSVSIHRWPDHSESPLRLMKLSLDTLSQTEVPDVFCDYKGVESRPSKHGNCELLLTTAWFLPDRGPTGDGVISLMMVDRERNYGKVISQFSNESWWRDFKLSWSPDFKTILQWNNGKASVVRLRLRNKPVLSFAIPKFLEQLSEGDQWDLFVALSRKDGVFLYIYEPEVNPINGKAIGPNYSKYKGHARIIKLGESVVIETSCEFSTPVVGDVVGRVFVESTRKQIDRWAVVEAVGDHDSALEVNVKRKGIDLSALTKNNVVVKKGAAGKIADSVELEAGQVARIIFPHLDEDGTKTILKSYRFTEQLDGGDQTGFYRQPAPVHLYFKMNDARLLTMEEFRKINDPSIWPEELFLKNTASKKNVLLLDWDFIPREKR